MSEAKGSGRGIWWAGLACASGAVALGLAYLVAAGAPARMIAMNLAAYLVGLAAYATLAVPNWRIGRARSWLLPGLAVALLAATIAGTPAEGAARWISFGPLTLQVSLIVVPAMLVLFARAPDRPGAASLSVAALVLALQPDRAMAGALAAGLLATALIRRDRLSLLALGASVAGFTAALAQPDRLPAVPFVDLIYYSSFEVHPFAGIAVLLGTALLIAPALFTDRAGAGLRAIVFAAVWATIAAAAAMGHHPTPVVGYGGSAIVGYLLSLALVRPICHRVGARGIASGPSRDTGDERSLSRSLA
jgi:cell division protein FtsW (lipid II flippase)